jgi:hypothetical protein
MIENFKILKNNNTSINVNNSIENTNIINIIPIINNIPNNTLVNALFERFIKKEINLIPFSHNNSIFFFNFLNKKIIYPEKNIYHLILKINILHYNQNNPIKNEIKIDLEKIKQKYNEKDYKKIEDIFNNIKIEFHNNNEYSIYSTSNINIFRKEKLNLLFNSLLFEEFLLDNTNTSLLYNLFILFNQEYIYTNNIINKKIINEQPYLSKYNIPIQQQDNNYFERKYSLLYTINPLKLLEKTFLTKEQIDKQLNQQTNNLTFNFSSLQNGSNNKEYIKYFTEINNIVNNKNYLLYFKKDYIYKEQTDIYIKYISKYFLESIQSNIPYYFNNKRKKNFIILLNKDNNLNKFFIQFLKNNSNKTYYEIPLFEMYKSHNISSFLKETFKTITLLKKTLYTYTKNSLNYYYKKNTKQKKEILEEIEELKKEIFIKYMFLKTNIFPFFDIFINNIIFQKEVINKIIYNNHNNNDRIYYFNNDRINNICSNPNKKKELNTIYNNDETIFLHENKNNLNSTYTIFKEEQLQKEISNNNIFNIYINYKEEYSKNLIYKEDKKEDISKLDNLETSYNTLFFNNELIIYKHKRKINTNNNISILIKLSQHYNIMKNNIKKEDIIQYYSKNYVLFNIEYYLNLLIFNTNTTLNNNTIIKSLEYKKQTILLQNETRKEFEFLNLYLENNKNNFLNIEEFITIKKAIFEIFTNFNTRYIHSFIKSNKFYINKHYDLDENMSKNKPIKKNIDIEINKNIWIQHKYILLFKNYLIRIIEDRKNDKLNTKPLYEEMMNIEEKYSFKTSIAFCQKCQQSFYYIYNQKETLNNNHQITSSKLTCSNCNNTQIVFLKLSDKNATPIINCELNYINQLNIFDNKIGITKSEKAFFYIRSLNIKENNKKYSFLSSFNVKYDFKLEEDEIIKNSFSIQKYANEKNKIIDQRTALFLNKNSKSLFGAINFKEPKYLKDKDNTNNVIDIEYGNSEYKEYNSKFLKEKYNKKQKIFSNTFNLNSYFSKKNIFEKEEIIQIGYLIFSIYNEQNKDTNIYTELLLENNNNSNEIKTLLNYKIANNITKEKAIFMIKNTLKNNLYLFFITHFINLLNQKKINLPTIREEEINILILFKYLIIKYNILSNKNIFFEEICEDIYYYILNLDNSIKEKYFIQKIGIFENIIFEKYLNRIREITLYTNHNFEKHTRQLLNNNKIISYKTLFNIYFLNDCNNEIKSKQLKKEISFLVEHLIKYQFEKHHHDTREKYFSIMAILKYIHLYFSYINNIDFQITFLKYIRNNLLYILKYIKIEHINKLKTTIKISQYFLDKKNIEHNYLDKKINHFFLSFFNNNHLKLEENIEQIQDIHRMYYKTKTNLKNNENKTALYLHNIFKNEPNKKELILNIEETHNYLSFLYSKLNTKEVNTILSLKEKEFEDELNTKIKEIDTNNTFNFILPNSNTQMLYWGEKLNICVGSYFGKTSTIVLGITKNNSIEYCLELTINGISQFRGRHNKPIKENDKDIIITFLQMANIPITNIMERDLFILKKDISIYNNKINFNTYSNNFLTLQSESKKRFKDLEKENYFNDYEDEIEYL